MSGGYYRGKMALLRQAFGGRCVDCGVTRRLQFSHVKPTEISTVGRGHQSRGRGLPQRYHDIRRHPDAYALRCWPCHVEFDHPMDEVPF